MQIRYEVRYTGVVSKKSNEKHREKLVSFCSAILGKNEKKS